MERLIHHSMAATSVTLLGTAQDGGVPQPGCTAACCMNQFGGVVRTRHPVALGVTDGRGGRHLFEATRALSAQLDLWASADGGPLDKLDSIWLTHGHLGHVEGLGQFGCEAWGVQNIPLHASQSMLDFVKANPMWRPLITDGNLSPKPFSTDVPVEIMPSLTVTPIQVPHRDEHTDTHAFLLAGENRRLLFLPDHDSWEMTLDIHGADDPRAWFRSLRADIVLLDGTFWSSSELGGKAGEIGHPPVKETLELLDNRRPGDPQVIFIHLNHSNPLHEEKSAESAHLRALGWEIGRQPMTFTI